MKFTKNLLLLITIMFVGIFYSKETYSKEKKLNTNYEYVTEKIKNAVKELYQKENLKNHLKTIFLYCTQNLGHKIGGAVFLWVN